MNERPNEFPFDRTSNVPAQLLSPAPSRRGFLIGVGAGAVGYVTTAAFNAPACSAKSVSAEITVVETFLKVVAVELPKYGDAITKILKVADDFNADYQRGDFVNAASIFATLEGDVTQLISDVGANLSPRVKMALVLIDAAVTAIGELLNSQKTFPAVRAARSRATAAQAVQASVIEKRANRVDKLFAAIQK